MTGTDFDQSQAIEFASLAMKLLKNEAKEKTFDNACKAVLQEDFEKFSQVCAAAGIPDTDAKLGFSNLHHMLYMMLRAGLAELPTMMVWP